MRRTVLLLACLTFAIHGLRLQGLMKRLQRKALVESQRAIEQEWARVRWTPLQALEALLSMKALAAFNSAGVAYFGNSPTSGNEHSPFHKESLCRRCVPVTMQDFDRAVDRGLEEQMMKEIKNRDYSAGEGPIFDLRLEEEIFPSPPYPDGLPRDAKDYQRDIPNCRWTSINSPDNTTGCYPKFRRWDDQWSPSCCYNEVEKQRHDEMKLQYDIDQIDFIETEDPEGNILEMLAHKWPEETVAPVGFPESDHWPEVKKFVEENPPEWNSNFPVRDYPFPKNEIEYMFLFRQVADIVDSYPLSEEEKERGEKIMNDIYWHWHEFEDYIEKHAKTTNAVLTYYGPIDEAMKFVIKHKVDWEPPPKHPDGWVNWVPESETDKQYNAIIERQGGGRR